MCGQLLESSTTLIPAEKSHGTAGQAVQILDSEAPWDAMPLFLLLWTPAALASYLPSVFAYQPSTQSLTLKGGIETAPWLNLVSMNRERCAPDLPYDARRRRGLNKSKPWWFCGTCASYWHASTPSTAADSDDEATASSTLKLSKAGELRLRVPMRNKLEGYYTKWHLDQAYAHLRPKLVELYPDLATLPRTEDVLEYHRRYETYVQNCRETTSQKRNRMTDEKLQKEKQWFQQQDLAWSPPPALCPWKTVVPAQYFDAASGCGDRHKWSLRTSCHANLVPEPQKDLVQDAWDCSAIASLRSADARACISIIRPCACYVEKRREGGGSSRTSVPTMQFQSGEISLRPLTPQEDEARGMLSGLLAHPDTLAKHFTLQEGEVETLPVVLQWLHKTTIPDSADTPHLCGTSKMYGSSCKSSPPKVASSPVVPEQSKQVWAILWQRPWATMVFRSSCL